MFQEIRSDDFRVHNNASIVLDWSHAPNKEDTFQEPIEGNNSSDVKRKELNNGENCKDDPIS